MAKSDSSVTPEKKLLNLIEDPSTAQATGNKKEFNVKELFSPAAWKAKLEFANEKILGLFKSNRSAFTVKRFIGFAKWSVFVVSVVLALNLVVEMLAVNEEVDFSVMGHQRQVADMAFLDDSITGSGFSGVVPERNIFVPYNIRAEKKEKEESGSSLKLVEMTEQLKLTGISIYPGDPSRTFCMIEDLQKNMTAFLREGDAIAGLTINKIKQDGVILKYQTDEIELK